MEIEQACEKDIKNDQERYEIGNYFKTMQAARIACEIMKKGFCKIKGINLDGAMGYY